MELFGVLQNPGPYFEPPASTAKGGGQNEQHAVHAYLGVAPWIPQIIYLIPFS